MSSFTTPLKVQPVAGGKWRLLEPFTYYMGYEDSGHAITADSGSITDFASIPRLFHIVLPPYHDQYGKAAVIHDVMYQRKLFSRAVCDAVFLEAMAVLGCPWPRRYAMYLAVRMFGWLPWKRNHAVVR